MKDKKIILETLITQSLFFKSFLGTSVLVLLSEKRIVDRLIVPLSYFFLNMISFFFLKAYFLPNQERYKKVFQIFSIPNPLSSGKLSLAVVNPISKQKILK